MTELNDRAAEALRGFEPSAVTDVTGFGLFGHVREMAERSGVRIALDARVHPGAPGRARRRRRRASAPAATAGIATSPPRCSSWTAIPEELVALGYDPQTAGGLLVSIAADKAAVLSARFQEEGLFLARVGRVEEGSGVAVS